MSGQLSLSDLLKVEDAHFQSRPRGVRRLDPRLKLALAAVAITLNVTLADLSLSLALGAVAWLAMLGSGVPVRQMAWFLLAPLWATLGIAGGYAVGFGVTPLWRLGPLTVYREGLWHGGGVAARVMADMGWAGLLFLTTPFAGILSALRWCRVPAVLVETLGFMYRYVFLLWDEFSAMRLSARARGGTATWWGTMKTTGSITGQVFLRAYDRAQRIAMAMKARGEQAGANGA